MPHIKSADFEDKRGGGGGKTETNISLYTV